MGAKRRRRRETWELPKTFVEAPVDKKGHRQRFDCEPRFLPLDNHENDRSLCTDEFTRCCDCGLVHHHTFNVIRVSNGKWYLVTRAYRVPGKK